MRTPRDLAAKLMDLQTQIMMDEATIEHLRGEVRALVRDLEEFQARYDKALKPMQMRIDVVKAAIEDIQQTRRKQQIAADFSEHYESVEEQFKRIWTKTQPDITDYRGNVIQNPVKKSSPTPRQKPENPLAYLKQLYRDLARRFHPDLAGNDEADRQRRTEIMTHINAAYAADDWEALEAISLEISGAELGVMRLASDDVIMIFKIRALEKEAESLENQIRMLEVERDAIFYGDMIKLKLEEKLLKGKGRDLLSELRQQMQNEYDALLQALDALRTTP